MAKQTDWQERGKALWMKRCLGLFSEEPKNTSSSDRFPLSLPHLELPELSHQPWGHFSPTVQSEEAEWKANGDSAASSQSRTQGQAGNSAALGSEGPRASLQASKENVFGHFQMSGNSNREFLCPNYCLSCTFWGRIHVITNSQSLPVEILHLVCTFLITAVRSTPTQPRAKLPSLWKTGYCAIPPKRPATVAHGSGVGDSRWRRKPLTEKEDREEGGRDLDAGEERGRARTPGSDICWGAPVSVTVSLSLHKYFNTYICV